MRFKKLKIHGMNLYAEDSTPTEYIETRINMALEAFDSKGRLPPSFDQVFGTLRKRP